MYERWGAEFLVAEGAGAGGHIGGIHLPMVSLVEEVRAHTTLPVVAAGGIDAGAAAVVLATGVAGLQLATRIIACSDGDVHAGFKEMDLGKGEQDVVVITSCVKGMKARAVRNEFTEALAGSASRRGRRLGSSGAQDTAVGAAPAWSASGRGCACARPAASARASASRTPCCARSSSATARAASSTPARASPGSGSKPLRSSSPPAIIADIEDGILRWEQAHGSILLPTAPRAAAGRLRQRIVHARKRAQRPHTRRGELSVAGRRTPDPRAHRDRP